MEDVQITGRTVRFQVKNLSLINAIRRVMLSNVPVHILAPTITENISSLKDEELVKKLRTIHLNQNKLKRKEFVLAVDGPAIVTTNDFTPNTPMPKNAYITALANGEKLRITAGLELGDPLSSGSYHF